MSQYLLLFAIVLGVNLMPAFGPPTWSVIVAIGINSQMPAWALVPIAALAAASGRYVLANGFRLVVGHISEKTRRNVAAARKLYERSKRNAIVALGLFALSPVPSAQLFEAAGLARIPLVSFTAAFFAGRVLSYSLYLLTARTIQHTSLGGALSHSLTSPWGLAGQAGMIALLIAFTRIDWEKQLAKVSK